jgi:hypothetical protein
VVDIFYFISMIITLYTLLVTALSDPGIIPRKDKLETMANATVAAIPLVSYEKPVGFSGKQ